MPDITRCTNCLSLIYDDDQVCHHCEEPLGKKRRRVFTRGTIAFILFSVTVFGVCDAVNMLDDLSDHRRAAHRIFDTFVLRAMSGNQDTCKELWHPDSSGELTAALAACAGVSTDRNIDVSTPTYVRRGKRMMAVGRNQYRQAMETYTFSCRVEFTDSEGNRVLVPATGTVIFDIYHRFDCQLVDWAWAESPKAHF